jgi:hypothetical protein
MFLKAALTGLVALAVLVSACTAPTSQSKQNNTTAVTQQANATPITAKILPAGNYSGIARDVESRVDFELAQHELDAQYTPNP